MPTSKKPRKQRSTVRTASDLSVFPDPRSLQPSSAEYKRAVNDETLWQAQELVYDSWETPDGRSRFSLARQALKLSVFCADAWLTLAERPTLSNSERRQMIERAVAAGELALGEGGLKENEGHFWGVLETRPYMRARGELGEVLWDAGEKEAAIQNYREMLILNPGDNQGIRYILAAKLLEMGKMDMLKSLMEQCADEYSPEIQYTRALIAYFEEAENAREIAEYAFETNRHVAGMLSGRVPTVPVGDYVTLGGKDQASSYVDANGTAWRQIPGAVEWLDEITSSVGVS